MTDLLEDGNLESVWGTVKHYADPKNSVPAIIDSTMNNKYAAGTAATVAGLYLARKIANRKKKIPVNEDPIKDIETRYSGFSSSEPLDFEKYKLKSVREQNENLPGSPMLPGIIPRNPRSVASFFIRRKMNAYDTNAENKDTKLQQATAARVIKKVKAQTGVDTTIGQLT